MLGGYLLLTTALLIFLFNIPFGYWRANVRRFSFQWYLSIHLPVPLIVLLRISLRLGWHWNTFVIFILSFFLGQLLGGMIHKRMLIKKKDHVSSCLVMDVYRNIC